MLNDRTYYIDKWSKPGAFITIHNNISAYRDNFIFINLVFYLTVQYMDFFTLLLLLLYSTCI